MKIISDFKKHVQAIRDQLTAIRGAIAAKKAKIHALDSAPLPPEEMLKVLSAKVDAGGKRYLSWLHSTGLEENATSSSVTYLAEQIDCKDSLGPLFFETDHRGNFAGFKHDALCFFFGDILKERFAAACFDYEPSVNMDDTIVSPMGQRLNEIAAAQAEVKQMELEEEDVEAALHEARVQIESLPG